MNKPVTREETYLAAMSGAEVNLPRPVTREEYYLAAGAGMDVDLPDPITRKELFLKRIAERGGNGEGSGGGEDAARAIVERTITEYVDSGITTVGERAFYNCKSLTKVEMPNLQTTASEAFVGCSSLKEFVSETATVIGTRNFQNCTALERVYLPLANNNINTAPGQFQGCTALKDVYIPVWRRPQGNLFSGCVSLEKLDMPMAYELQTKVFYGCVNLKALSLRSFANNAVVTLTTDAFSGTPFAESGTGGVLLIPSALVESYKTATNWSAVYAYGHNRFLALEDYTVDGTVTGEIDWDRVESLFE